MASNANVGANHIGLPYASFLLGAVDTAEVDSPSRVRFGKQQWGFYVQDSWKVTRKLTLDLGLRYDYSTWYKEQYGRSPNLAPNLADPTAGGHPGATIYQATCGCSFANNYPWGFGPRFGMAYQITPKTVFRGGFGVAYTGTPQYNLGGGAISATDPIGPAGTAGLPIMTLAGGVPLTQAQIAWPNFNPGFYPVNGVFPGAGPAQFYDPNAGRPARQYQWSFGIQREIFRNLLVEASYIGNRGIWWTNNSLVNYNYLSTAILNQYGLSLSNPADIAILSAPLNSPTAGRFMNKIPFTGFPLTATVAQSLRPFPRFSSGLNGLASPLGDTWYDSLQTKVTKRYSHGLDLTFAFTWSKSIDNFVGTPDIQNRHSRSLSVIRTSRSWAVWASVTFCPNGDTTRRSRSWSAIGPSPAS